MEYEKRNMEYGIWNMERLQSTAEWNTYFILHISYCSSENGDGR